MKARMIDNGPKARVRVGKLLVLGIAALLATGNAMAQVKCRKVFHQPFDGNDVVRQMALHDGKLFIAVGGLGKGVMKIFRADDLANNKWTEVTPKWKASPTAHFLAMRSYKGMLFVGTKEGELHCVAAKGTQPAMKQFLGVITDLEEFKDELYLSCGGFYRSADGVSWQPLAKTIQLAADEKREFDGVFEVLGKHLYFGFGYSKDPKNELGIQVWRTSDGTTWKLFKKLSGAGPSDAPQHVHAMKAHDAHLYVGAYDKWSEKMEVYRTDGSEGNWETQSIGNASGSITALESYAQRLFAGSFVYYDYLAGYELLHYTGDGKHWSAVPNVPPGDKKSHGIHSMVTHDGKLYFGTYDTGNGGEVFEVTLPPLPLYVPDYDKPKTLLDDKFSLHFDFEAQALGRPFQIKEDSVAVVAGSKADEEFTIEWSLSGDEKEVDHFRVSLVELFPERQQPFGRTLMRGVSSAQARRHTGRLEVVPSTDAHYVVPVVVASPVDAKVTSDQRVGAASPVFPASQDVADLPQPKWQDQFTYELADEGEQGKGTLSPNRAPAASVPMVQLAVRAASHTALLFDAVPTAENIILHPGTGGHKTTVTLSTPSLSRGRFRLVGYLGFLGRGSRPNALDVEMKCHLKSEDGERSDKSVPYVQQLSLATTEDGPPVPMKRIEQIINTSQFDVGQPPYQLVTEFTFQQSGSIPIDREHPPVLFGWRLLGAGTPPKFEPDLTVDWYGYEQPFIEVKSKGVYPFPPLTDRPTILQAVIENLGHGAVHKSFETTLYVDDKPVASFPFPSEADMADTPPGQKILLEHGDTRDYSHAVSISQPGDHKVRWVVDDKKTVEVNPKIRKNNETELTLSWQDPPDLRVDNIFPAYEMPLGGQPATWKIRVTNHGKGKVALPFLTTFWPNVAGGSQQNFWYSQGLAPGASQVFESKQNFSQWGKHKLQAQVDVQNYVPEALPDAQNNIPDGEKNNESIKEFDLQEVDFWVGQPPLVKPKNPVLGDLVTFRFTIRNGGDAPALKPFKVKLFPGKVSGGLLSPVEFSVNSLGAGKDLELTSDPLPLPAGDHTVAIQIDPESVYSEEKGDNIETFTIHVRDFTEPFEHMKHTSGVNKVLVILWDPDRRGHPRPSKTHVRDTFFGKKNSVAAMFSEISAGQFTIKEEAILGWYGAERSADYYWGLPDMEDLHEDRNNNKKLDPGEDLNGNGELDGPDGILQSDEDLNGNRKLDVDLNEDGWVKPHVHKWTEMILMADKEFDFSQYDADGNGELEPDELAICLVIPQQTGFGTAGATVVGREYPSPQRLVVDNVALTQIAEFYMGHAAYYPTATHELCHLLLHAGDMYFQKGSILEGMKKLGMKEHPNEARFYSLMDVMAYHLDPFHKLKAGWLKPKVVAKSGWYTLNDIETSYEAMILPDPHRTRDEYFILENRWPANTYDKGLPDKGLALWHIIEDPNVYQNINEPYLPIGAWGRRAVRLRRVNGGKPVDDKVALWDGSDSKTSYELSDDSKPTNLRWQDGSPSGLKIKNVSPAGPTMKMYIEVPQVKHDWTAAKMPSGGSSSGLKKE